MILRTLIVGDSHARVWIGNSKLFSQYGTYDIGKLQSQKIVRCDNDINLSYDSFPPDYFIVESVGEYTSFKLREKGDVINKIDTYLSQHDVVNNKTILMLAFGEIDCRAHLASYLGVSPFPRSEDRALFEEVEKAQKPLLELYDKYFQFYRVLWGIHLAYPGVERGSYINGSLEIRKKIINEWNRQLKIYGEKNNIPLLNPNDYEGDLSKKLMFIEHDPVHLWHDRAYPWLYKKLEEISDLFQELP